MRENMLRCVNIRELATTSPEKGRHDLGVLPNRVAGKRDFNVHMGRSEAPLRKRFTGRDPEFPNRKMNVSYYADDCLHEVRLAFLRLKIGVVSKYDEHGLYLWVTQFRLIFLHHQQTNILYFIFN